MRLLQKKNYPLSPAPNFIKQDISFSWTVTRYNNRIVSVVGSELFTHRTVYHYYTMVRVSFLFVFFIFNNSGRNSNWIVYVCICFDTCTEIAEKKYLIISFQEISWNSEEGGNRIGGRGMDVGIVEGVQRLPGWVVWRWMSPNWVDLRGTSTSP